MLPDSLVTVQVDSVYYTGLLNKRWCSYLLADEPERMVLARANGSPLWSGKGHYWMPPGSAIEFYPREEWFNMACFLGSDGTFQGYYLNIALPPMLRDGTLTFTDLDLDLIVNPDLSYVIDDEDEFLDHCDLWAYPADLCERARTTLNSLTARIERRDPLFDEWKRYYQLLLPEFVSGDAWALTPPSS